MPGSEEFKNVWVIIFSPSLVILLKYIPLKQENNKPQSINTKIVPLLQTCLPGWNSWSEVKLPVLILKALRPKLSAQYFVIHMVKQDNISHSYVRWPNWLVWWLVNSEVAYWLLKNMVRYKPWREKDEVGRPLMTKS